MSSRATNSHGRRLSNTYPIDCPKHQELYDAIHGESGSENNIQTHADSIPSATSPHSYRMLEASESHYRECSYNSAAPLAKSFARLLHHVGRCCTAHLVQQPWHFADKNQDGQRTEDHPRTNPCNFLRRF
eukprot:2186626-Amphidinium_carterae.1